MARYATIYGIVSSISPFNTSVSDHTCSLLFLVNTQNLGQVNFIVSPQTYVLEQNTFQPGQTIVAIYDTSVPVALIYPPQYRAVIVAKNDDGYMAALDYFDEDLLNISQNMQLNIPEDGTTSVLLSNGQNFLYNPGGHYLFVLYMFGSDDIPEVITPQKVIVFCSPTE